MPPGDVPAVVPTGSTPAAAVVARTVPVPTILCVVLGLLLCLALGALAVQAYRGWVWRRGGSPVGECRGRAALGGSWGFLCRGVAQGGGQRVTPRPRVSAACGFRSRQSRGHRLQRHLRGARLSPDAGVPGGAQSLRSVQPPPSAWQLSPKRGGSAPTQHQVPVVRHRLTPAARGCPPVPPRPRSAARGRAALGAGSGHPQHPILPPPGSLLEGSGTKLPYYTEDSMEEGDLKTAPGRGTGAGTRWGPLGRGDVARLGSQGDTAPPPLRGEPSSTH